MKRTGKCDRRAGGRTDRRTYRQQSVNQYVFPMHGKHYNVYIVKRKVNKHLIVLRAIQ